VAPSGRRVAPRSIRARRKKRKNTICYSINGGGDGVSARSWLKGSSDQGKKKAAPSLKGERVSPKGEVSALNDLASELTKGKKKEGRCCTVALSGGWRGD